MIRLWTVCILKLHYIHGSVYHVFSFASFPRAPIYCANPRERNMYRGTSKEGREKRSLSVLPGRHYENKVEARAGDRYDQRSIVRSHSLVCRSRCRDYSVRKRLAGTTMQSGPGRPKAITKRCSYYRILRAIPRTPCFCSVACWSRRKDKRYLVSLREENNSRERKEENAIETRLP